MIRMIERAGGGGLFECGSCDARFVFEHVGGADRIDDLVLCPVCGANRDTKEDCVSSFRRCSALFKSQQPEVQKLRLARHVEHFMFISRVRATINQ